jgi:hypothetical protein
VTWAWMLAARVSSGQLLKHLGRTSDVSRVLYQRGELGIGLRCNGFVGGALALVVVNVACLGLTSMVSCMLDEKYGRSVPWASLSPSNG